MTVNEILLASYTFVKLPSIYTTLLFLSIDISFTTSDVPLIVFDPNGYHWFVFKSKYAIFDASVATLDASATPRKSPLMYKLFVLLSYDKYLTGLEVPYVSVFDDGLYPIGDHRFVTGFQVEIYWVFNKALLTSFEVVKLPPVYKIPLFVSNVIDKQLASSPF